MARPTTFQGTNGTRVLFDDTLPLNCVIESSQLVEGHGVMIKMKFVFSFLNELSILILGIFYSCCSGFKWSVTFMAGYQTF